MPYLRKEDLQILSRAKQKRKIAHWLDSLGIKFINDSQGWPLADESALRAKLGESVKNEPRINFA